MKPPTRIVVTVTPSCPKFPNVSPSWPSMDFYFPTTSTDPKTHDFGCCLSILGLGFVRHLPSVFCHSSRPWVTWGDLASYIQTWLLRPFFSASFFLSGQEFSRKSLDMFFLICSHLSLETIWKSDYWTILQLTVRRCHFEQLKIYHIHMPANPCISLNIMESCHTNSTPGKIDMEPKNGGLEDYFPFQFGIFFRSMWIFRGVNCKKVDRNHLPLISPNQPEGGLSIDHKWRVIITFLVLFFETWYPSN